MLEKFSAQKWMFIFSVYLHTMLLQTKSLPVIFVQYDHEKASSTFDNVSCRYQIILGKN